MRLHSGLLAIAVLTTAMRLPAQSPETEPVSRPAAVHPSIGLGYVPYGYPGVNRCPCADDDCYPPARYYCGGEAYRRHWFRKWLNAQFCGGSMLDDYPCRCVCPTVGRVWIPPASRIERLTEPLPGANGVQPEIGSLD